jgi:fumarate reductase subunit C
MPLGSKDITILLVGICIMLVGFFVMTLDKEEFGFGFLGITLGPIVVLVGIIIPVFSLFKWKR